MSALEIQLLGSPHIQYAGKPLDIGTRKGIALLAYLAVEQQPQQRTTIATLLWADLDETRGRGALRSTLSQLKKALNDEWLVVERQTVQLAEGYQCDVVDFQNLIATCRAFDHPSREPCTPLLQAIDLYHGSFMAGFSLRDSYTFDDWQRQQGEVYHNELIRALTTSVPALLQQQRYDDAFHYAQRWLEIEPWAEEAHRHLIWGYAQVGKRPAALQQYSSCVDILAEELGIEPSAETRALYEQIKANTFVKQVETPSPAPTIPAPQMPAPPRPTAPLLGREKEWTKIEQHLTDPQCRLLTLIGVGGIGKTRLALEVAQEGTRFAGNVAFVPLDGLDSHELIISAIADAVAFSFYGQADPQTQLLHYLQGKSLLLILDNFEHVLAHVDIVQAILAHAPQVKVLVTSRERLQLRDEWIIALTGLSVPTTSPDTSIDHSAVALFIQTAQRQVANFDGEAQLPAIARICQLVEGLPLGIELAAAWVRMLSCQEIAQEIAESLDFLTTSLRDVPERHASLRAAFQQSWQRLGTREQTSFAQLSLFAGRFDRQAAKAVAQANLALLSTLLDKSLLQHEGDGQYQVPAILRAYGQEELTDPETTRQRLMHHFAHFVAERTADLQGGRQLEALNEIGQNLDNVRQMWQWANAGRASEFIRQSYEGLFLFYEMRNRFPEGLIAFQQAGQAFADHDTPLHACLQARQGRFCLRLGRYDDAHTLLQNSLAVARATHNIQEIAFVLGNLGFVSWHQSQYEQAKAYYEESLQLYEQLKDTKGIAGVLNGLGVIPQERTQTEAYLRRSLKMSRAIGDLWGTARVLNNLGVVIQDLDELKALLTESVDITRQIGAHFLTIFPLLNLGLMHHLQGQFKTAQALYTDSLTICDDLGYRPGKAHALRSLARAALSLGQFEEAEEKCRQGLTISEELNDLRGQGITYYTLGDIAFRQGDHEQAKQAYQQSYGIHEKAGEKQGLGWSQLGLCMVAIAENDWEDANSLAQQSLDSCTQTGNQDGLWQIHLCLNQIALHDQQEKEAYKHLIHGLEISQKRQSVPAMLQVLLSLAQQKHQLGEIDEALALYTYIQQQETAEFAIREQATQYRVLLLKERHPLPPKTKQSSLQGMSLLDMVRHYQQI